MSDAPSRPQPPHIVHVDRRWRCTCPSLSRDTLERIEIALRAAGLWFDRWTYRGGRKLMLEVLSAKCGPGLVLLGPNLPFAAPSAFTELFEPILLGTRDEQLKSLSDWATTNDERIDWRRLLGIPAVLLFWIFTGIVNPRSTSVLIPLTIAALAIAWPTLRRLCNRTLVQRTFLVPGALAVVRRRRGRWQSPDLLTRFDSYVALRREVHDNVPILRLDVYRADGQRVREIVTEREAIALLAAWQSPLPTPTPEKLRELVA